MFFSNGQPLQNHWISYSKGPRLKSLLKSNPLTINSTDADTYNVLLTLLHVNQLTIS